MNLKPYFPKQTTQDIDHLLKIWNRGEVACLLSPRSPRAEIKKQLSILPRRLKNAATIMFTSGSSGQPKAVVHSFRNHYFSALGSNENIPLQPGDRWLMSLPLYHVSGLSILCRCWIAGATVVFPQKNQTLEDAIKKYRITHISVVTTQLRRLLKKKTVLKNLKAILLGGGPIPDDLLKATQNLPVYPTYGLTEMTSQVATAKKPGGPLYVLPYRKLKIVKGEIYVGGQTLFLGYWNKGKLQKTGKWFKTGDLGTYSKKDGLRVLGRKDNLFISGGENIYPEEIETALLNTGLVSQVVVVPVKNKEFGARPTAFITPLRKATVINAALKKTLPSFKIPDHYYPFPEAYKPKGLKPDRLFLQKQLNSL